MATATSEDTQLRLAQSETNAMPSELASEMPDVPCKVEECRELSESAAAENNDVCDLETDNLSQTVSEGGKKQESTVEASNTTATTTNDGEKQDAAVTEKQLASEEVTKNRAEHTTNAALEESKPDSLPKKKFDRRRRRSRRWGRSILRRKLASLNLPDGIILVRDRRYTGYHCTFCNCVLRSLVTVKAHVDGKWHKQTLQIKDVNEDNKGKSASTTKSAGTATEKALPTGPLKSSLEEYLSITKTPIVGLSYIIETQRQSKEPTFQCNLCEVSYVSDNIKEHISGMKHCLMYLKLMKPAKLAELLAKQLNKAEKNEEIAKLSTELEEENGRGEITVKAASQEKEQTGAKASENRPSNKLQSGRGKIFNRFRRGGSFKSQANRSRSNRPPARSSNANQRNRNSQGIRRRILSKAMQRKRGNESLSPARKRQFQERDFQARMQYSFNRGQNNFFPDAWGMEAERMDVAPYQNEANFYPNYPNFYPPSYGERRRFNRPGYASEQYERIGHLPERESYYRERYGGRQPYWSDRHDNFAPNKPRSYSGRAAASAHREQRAEDSNVQVSALRRLAGFNVTSDEDAGVVINAINSLTNSFMNYKLRDLPGPVQQLLQKSLKGSDLTAFLNARDKANEPTRDRHDGRSSSSRANRDWGISQIAKPQNWLF